MNQLIIDANLFFYICNNIFDAKSDTEILYLIE